MAAVLGTLRSLCSSVSPEIAQEAMKLRLELEGSVNRKKKEATK